MEIIVQGTGTKSFTPNEVILDINFYVKGNNYEETLREGVKNVEKFINEILLKTGFTKEEMKTRNFSVREEKKYDEIARTYLMNGYSFNQNAKIKFDYDRERLANIMEKLSKMDDAPNCRINFGIKDKKECKRQILASAYKDAELQAEAIANASRKALKQCVKIDFKPITTNYISRAGFDGDMMCKTAIGAGVKETIVNTFIPEDIELSETLYCVWITE